MKDETLLTIKQLCTLLQVKESWARHQVFLGRIPFIKVGRLIRFERSAIEAWLKNTK